MKILHVADTHLGYSAYRKVTEDGINQREQDTYDVFKQFVDYALETKPDLILHGGDLFDSVRPTNRAITFAIQQILRLSKKGIPFIVIAGNHEHPKLKETGHIFSIFEHIKHVYPIYKEHYETISFTIKKEKLTIHAIPQCSIKTDFEREIKKPKQDGAASYNIFMAHGAVKGIKEFSMNEFNELMIPTSALKKKFDYIALGHYHKYTKLEDNAFYAGSPERFTFTDAGEQKGFIELELKKTLKRKFIPLKTRTMIDAVPINCKGLPIEKLMKAIKETIMGIQPAGKIFRISLEDIPSPVYRGIDFRAIRELSGGAVHYEIKANVVDEANVKRYETAKIGALINEFDLFLKDQKVEEKQTLRKLGMEYIERFITEKEGT